MNSDVTEERSADRAILSFDSHLGQHIGMPDSPPGAVTLRDYYLSEILPEISHQAPGSLAADRTALKRWERHSGNPDIRQTHRRHIERLRDGMLEAGLAPATINRTWRECKMMFQVAVDEGVIDRVPTIGHGMKSWLVRETPKRHRELITEGELARLWHACDAATYPDPRRYPTAQIWRSLLLFFWLYGPRTRDLLRLRWDSIFTKSRMLRFEAMKTRKLQALPLTDLACGHLIELRGIDREYVFGPMKSAGNCAYGRHANGYYATWKAEIQPAAKIKEPIQFKHFRESMVSNMNGIEPALGNWIAGHYVPGVSAQYYDMPTRRIRRAIESVKLPDCFQLSSSPWIGGGRQNHRKQSSHAGPDTSRPTRS